MSQTTRPRAHSPPAVPPALSPARKGVYALGDFTLNTSLAGGGRSGRGSDDAVELPPYPAAARSSRA